MEWTFVERGLIDTDILIDSLRGIEPAKKILYQQYEISEIHISVISAMELIRGSLDSGDLKII